MIERWSLVDQNAHIGESRAFGHPEYVASPIKGKTRWQLTLVLNRDLLVNNPDIVLVCGDRIFHAIEDTAQGDLDDGLFRERRSNGDAHQPGI